MKRNRLLWVVLCLGLTGHAILVGFYTWPSAKRANHGRDFASYYYAVDVVTAGGNPYDKKVLVQAARADQKRSGVHPYFYPPPFLLFFQWVIWLPLATAYRLWFWLDELATLAAVLSLWRWWRPLGPAVLPVTVVAVALCSAVPNNHMMGQMNLPVLAMVLGSLYFHSRDRAGVAGVLLGTACMWKMSPALFVLYWLWERQWRPAFWALGTMVALSITALVLWGVDVTWSFYGTVLPGFGSGTYNGLSVPISVFGNHSIANLWHAAWPKSHPGLSDAARIASGLSALGLAGVTAAVFQRNRAGVLGFAARPAALCALMLMLPVYTYEHHLIWLLPAVVLTVLATAQGRIPWFAVVPLVFSWCGWAFPLWKLKQWAIQLNQWGYGEWASVSLQEWKTASCFILWLACLFLILRSPALPGQSGERGP